MRFAVQGPGCPVASPRSHGVPRRDVEGRVHISVAGVSAGGAPEGGLALARLRVHVPARRAALAGERGSNLFYPPGRLVLQAADQQAPSRGQDAPIQACLLADVPARGIPGSSRGPGHVRPSAPAPVPRGERPGAHPIAARASQQCGTPRSARLCARSAAWPGYSGRRRPPSQRRNPAVPAAAPPASPRPASYARRGRP